MEKNREIVGYLYIKDGSIIYGDVPRENPEGYEKFNVFRMESVCAGYQLLKNYASGCNGKYHFEIEDMVLCKDGEPEISKQVGVKYNGKCDGTCGGKDKGAHRGELSLNSSLVKLLLEKSSSIESLLV